MNKVEVILKVCCCIFLLFTFVWTNYKEPIPSGNAFVVIAASHYMLGVWVIYRDYKKDQRVPTN